MSTEASDGSGNENFADSAAHTNPFSCNVCGKTYSRIDHLARHHRSHGKLKPFSCQDCGKQFGRMDVLKRHAEAHDGNHAEPLGKRRQVTSVSDGRVNKACDACAAAKVKCDDAKPCRRCKQRGVDCTNSKVNINAASGSGVIPQIRTSTSAQPVKENSSGMPSTMGKPGAEEDGTAFIDLGLDQQRLPSDASPKLDFLLNDLSNANDLNVFDAVLSNQSIDILQASRMTDNSSLTEFLNDLVVPPSFDHNRNEAADKVLGRPYSHQDLLDFGVGPFHSTDMDFLLATESAYNPSAPLAHADQRQEAAGTRTPAAADAIGLSTAAFTKSLWRYAPTEADKSTAEQLHLSLPYPNFDSPETQNSTEPHVLEQTLPYSLRDKILATVLKTCDKALYADIVASFPSLDLLNNLLHHAINANIGQVSTWLHLPTFDLSCQRTELLIMLVAAGATNCSAPKIRKLGFALQEAARVALRQTSENDNRSIRDLQFSQAFALELHVGLWSGDRRKMEIAESFLQPLITMMRRGGRFKLQREVEVKPLIKDSHSDIQRKWTTWVELESYKRLVFHLLMHDSKSSMALQVPPLISLAEITLDMPASNELWTAPSSLKWRDVYIKLSSECVLDANPSISTFLSDIGQLRNDINIDTPYCTMIVLYCVWHLIWDRLQLSSIISESSTQNSFQGSLLANSWQQELLKLLEQIGMTFTDMPRISQPELLLVYQRMLLNLHISFESVQLLAGKEGEEESRRVYPILRRWSESSIARRALWHAGQVLRAASQCTAAHLRDIGAISLYHAGLTFWAYEVVAKINKNRTTKSNTSVPGPTQQAVDSVWLDGVDCPAVQRFINLNRGTPMIQNWGQAGDGKSAGIPLNASKQVMDSCISVLRTKAVLPIDRRVVLPMVDKLTQLMRDLGNAANGIGRK